MVIRVEHELHQRRRGRNTGVGLILGAFAVIVFGLSVVKVLSLSNPLEMQGYDHAVQPMAVPETPSQ
jgi:hypothetical protein